MTETGPEDMNITYLFDGYVKENEGVPNYIRGIGDYMQAQGHDVDYVVGGGEDLDSSMHVMGRTVNFRSNKNRVEMALYVSGSDARGLLEETEPDVMHLQMPNNPFASGNIVRKAKGQVPVVGTFHVLPGSKVNELVMRAQARTQSRLSPVDHVISNSTATQEYLQNVWGIDSTLIPCPIDVDSYRQGKKLEKYDDGKTNIVFLGRLVERKGARHLVDAVSKLGKGMQEEVRLIIAGSGELDADLRKQVADLGLEQQVEFIGEVSEEQKPDVYATGDLTVLPATGGESFGIVLVEAMASGSLTLGGNNPGYSSTLSDTPELIFDPRNPDQLAELLTDLINDKAKANELREIQQRLVDKFDITFVGAQIEQVYRDLLSS